MVAQLIFTVLLSSVFLTSFEGLKYIDSVPKQKNPLNRKYSETSLVRPPIMLGKSSVTRQVVFLVRFSLPGFQWQMKLFKDRKNGLST